MNWHRGIFRLRITVLALILLLCGGLAWSGHSNNSKQLDEKISRFEEALARKADTGTLHPADKYYGVTEEAKSRLAGFKADKRKSLYAAVLVPLAIGLIYWLLGSLLGWIVRGFRHPPDENNT